MSIGFIGIGAMGKPMVKNLIKAKYDVVVYDVMKEAVAEMAAIGAKSSNSPKDMAMIVDLVITMLPNAQIVENALLGETGFLAGSRSGQIIIDMSSVGPHSTRKMAEISAGKGVRYLDAPVSGGVAGAEKGSLTIMVGGEEETVALAMPIFQVLGERIHHVGEVGSGDAVKLVNNMMFGCNMAAMAEALVMGVKAGLKPSTMYEIIKASSGASYALTAKYPNFITKGNFAGGFAVDLQYKDLGLALETAKSYGVPTPVSTIAQQVFEMARAKGMGREDMSAVIKIWEELTGIQVRE